MANIDFEATNVEPDQGGNFEPLPAGEYKVVISESDVQQAKSGNGEYLKLQMQVIEGPFENRVLFANINIRHANPKAQQIGQGQLSALYHAVGKLKVRDTAELHDIPFVVKVKVKNDAQYGPGNDVTAYKSAGQQLAQQQVQQPPAQQQQQQAYQPGQAGQAVPPWKR